MIVYWNLTSFIYLFSYYQILAVMFYCLRIVSWYFDYLCSFSIQWITHSIIFNIIFVITVFSLLYIFFLVCRIFYTSFLFFLPLQLFGRWYFQPSSGRCLIVFVSNRKDWSLHPIRRWNCFLKLKITERHISLKKMVIKTTMVRIFFQIFKLLLEK